MNNIFEAIEADSLPAVQGALDTEPSCLHQPFSADLPNLPLHAAAAHDRAGIISLLLKNGADVNARGDMHRTPLHYAARNGCLSAFKALLGAGANTDLQDNKRWTPLLEALRGRDGECEAIANLLFEGRASTDISALVSLGQVEAVCRILRSDEKAVAQSTLPADLIYDFVIMLGARIDKVAGVEASEAQQTAVIAEYRDILPCLLAAGIDIDGVGVSGEPPLFAAARSYHSELVRLLLDRGANVNICLNSQPGWNALTVATGSYSKGVHRVLREYGFNLYKKRS